MVWHVAILICSGRTFYEDGPQAEKVFSANLRAECDTTSLFPQLDLSSLLGMYDSIT